MTVAGHITGSSLLPEWETATVAATAQLPQVPLSHHRCLWCTNRSAVPHTNATRHCVLCDAHDEAVAED